MRKITEFYETEGVNSILNHFVVYFIRSRVGFALKCTPTPIEETVSAAEHSESHICLISIQLNLLMCTSIAVEVARCSFIGR